jgi:hypothetical protein
MSCRHYCLMTTLNCAVSGTLTERGHCNELGGGGDALGIRGSGRRIAMPWRAEP